MIEEFSLTEEIRNEATVLKDEYDQKLRELVSYMKDIVKKHNKINSYIDAEADR